MKHPVWPHYFADPMVLKTQDAYYAYGTGDAPDGRQFPVLRSTDFQTWELVGGALDPLPNRKDYWAPEVAERHGKYFMYFSASGQDGDETHRLRVAVADHPAGPFVDAGHDLLPQEGFTIDGHPFQDPKDGRWYLFFAKDYFDGRVGTGTAVVALNDDMVSTSGPVVPVVRASADWQIYERNRTIYGRQWDAWHTVEGPFVVFHDGRYYCFYSGGPWNSEQYGVSYGVAENVMGPYRDDHSQAGPTILKGTATEKGPGHNSVVIGPDGKHHLVYHAWDPAHTARRMFIDPLDWSRLT